MTLPNDCLLMQLFSSGIDFDHENGIPADLGFDTKMDIEEDPMLLQCDTEIKQSYGSIDTDSLLKHTPDTAVSNGQPGRTAASKPTPPSNICSSLEEWRKKTSGEQDNSGYNLVYCYYFDV